MTRRATFCPGCGAPVHPRAMECPECGGLIERPSRLLPAMVGIAGILVAGVAGLGVWILLTPAPGPAESAPPQPVVAAVPAAAPPPVAAPSAPAPVAAQSPAPLDPPPPSAVASSPAVPSPAASQPSPNAPQQPVSPLADAPTRRSFAKATQDSFSKNGLDLAVSTSGPDATTITIKFNFPASTAVDLIMGGPFLRQCKIRGFRTIIFTDPSGATWTYDVESEKLVRT